MSSQATQDAVCGVALRAGTSVDAMVIRATALRANSSRYLSCNVGVLICLAIAGLLLTACSDPRFEWREQVRLQNGQTLIVERVAEFSENWVAGGGGGSVNKGMSLRVTQPAGPDTPAVWNALYVPMLLDRDAKTQEWAIVATFFHCDSWQALGKPKLPYTEYRYRNGSWVQQSLSPQWIGRPANVLVVDPSRKSAMTDRNTLTVENKEAIVEGSTMLPEYRRIVDHWSSGC